MIKFNGVTKSFQSGTVGLKNITLDIDEGEFVFLVGASGAGKSTFTKLLIHEYLPTSGSIYVNGRNINNLKKKEIPHFRRNIGFIFQNYRLLNDRTAYENVAFAVEVQGLPDREVRKKVNYALRKVGLENRKDHFPNQLSGGEQQRVAIARAIVNNPQIIIADEPTGNLDPETAREIMKILNTINKNNTTVIMATHDSTIVNEESHRVIELSHGELIRDEKQGGYQIEIC